MSEDLIITKRDKEGLYEEILPQIEALLSGETDVIANFANAAAALHEAFSFWWTGFYINKGGVLVLGPFQGPVACTRISCGRGVCGTAFAKSETIVVEDVREFPGHIACSSLSLSEIVVPLILEDGTFYGVLDIDSEKVGTFDDIDKKYLEKLASIICKTLN